MGRYETPKFQFEGEIGVDICKECYSEENRSTPLLHLQDCLESHTKYLQGLRI